MSDASARPRASLRGALTRLLVGVGAVLVVGLVVGVLAFGALLDAEDRLVRRIQPARLAAARLELALVDQETGVRGYALGTDARFLEPFVSGLEAEQLARDRIVATLGDDPAVVARLDAVTAAADAWRTEVADPVIAAVEAGTGRAVLDLLEEAGASGFDGVRSALADLGSVLDDRRTGAIDDLEAAEAQLVGVGLGLAALLVVSGAAVAVSLRRQVLRPLVTLADESRRVADGDLEHQIAASGPAELASVAHDVESMRLRIVAELATVSAARAALDARTVELERSNRDLEQFAYVASHDLQEPLRKVAGFCELLQRRYAGQLDERADQYIGFAIDGSRRMQALIDDLLAFSRVGRTTEAFTDLDLAAALARAWDDVVGGQAASMAGVAPAVGEGAELEVLGSLPAVRGDANLVHALLANLLGNAVKFHREGVPAVVQVWAEPIGEAADPPRWRVVVADNGIGVDPRFADRIFVLFQRLHARDRFEGTGIGLALCARIVEFHGGSIALVGRPDPDAEPGATFVFDLPAAGSDYGPARTATAGVAAPASEEPA